MSSRVISLLDCLHFYDGPTTSVGDLVHCHWCHGEERQVVTRQKATGQYVAVCDECDYRKGAGSAKKLAELYSTHHPHNDVSVVWEDE